MSQSPLWEFELRVSKGQGQLSLVVFLGEGMDETALGLKQSRGGVFFSPLIKS